MHRVLSSRSPRSACAIAPRTPRATWVTLTIEQIALKPGKLESKHDQVFVKKDAVTFMNWFAPSRTPGSTQ